MGDSRRTKGQTRNEFASLREVFNADVTDDAVGLAASGLLAGLSIRRRFVSMKLLNSRRSLAILAAA